jgi:hypothetical protein
VDFCKNEIEKRDEKRTARHRDKIKHDDLLCNKVG